MTTQRYALLGWVLLSLVACSKNSPSGAQDASVKPDAGAVTDAAAVPDAAAVRLDGGVAPSDSGAAQQDAGTMVGSRCERACAAFDKAYQDNCLRSASMERFGLRPHPYAMAFEIEPSFTVPLIKLQRALPQGQIYLAPRAEVVLVERADLMPSPKLQVIRSQLKRLPVLLTEQGRPVVLGHNLVLALQPGTKPEQVLAKEPIQNIRKLPFGESIYSVRIAEPERVLDLAYELQQKEGVRFAEPSFTRRYQKRALPPQDPLFERQWHLQASQSSSARVTSHAAVVEAWNVSEGDARVVIGIFDDGVDTKHPDLQTQIVPGVSGPTNIDGAIQEGCCGHGTPVAAVAAAAGNELGGRGVCPGCKVMPIWEDGSASMGEDIATAMTFTRACDQGAWVINNSWGSPDGDPSLIEENAPADTLPRVVANAFSHCERRGRGGLGTVIVFAAGNGNEDVSSDPFVTHPLTVGVAASSAQGHKSYYSDFGKGVTITAPSNGDGLGIVTAAVRGEGDLGANYTGGFGGTSSAAPLISGALGLIFSVAPSLTAEQARTLLYRSADKIDRLKGNYDQQGWSPFYGYGKVNTHRAVLEALKSSDSARCAQQPEVCNGVDDNCDGQIDEGCAKSALCEACSFDAACGSGLCVRTPHDEELRCSQSCQNDGECGEGYSCQANLCLPRKGRCAAPIAEKCNGIDDDADGEVDEGVCIGGEGPCFHNDQCPASDLCIDGECRTRCNSTADCSSGGECHQAAGRYGKGLPEKICGRPSQCIALICGGLGNLPQMEVDDFLSCVERGNLNSCDDTLMCLPPSIRQ